MTRIVKAPEERRVELINAAQKLFFEKGYNDTTVRDIIKAVGGSQGMFYHYFQSKDEVYHVAMEEFVRTYVGELREIFYSREINSIEKIGKIMHRFIMAYNTTMGIINKNNSPDNIHYMLELKGRIVDGIIEPLEALINEFILVGIIDIDDIIDKDVKSTAFFLANGLFGLINGYKNKASDVTKIDDQKKKQLLKFMSRTLGRDDDFLINITLKK